jgi:hypothetical protein
MQWQLAAAAVKMWRSAGCGELLCCVSRAGVLVAPCLPVGCSNLHSSVHQQLPVAHAPVVYESLLLQHFCMCADAGSCTDAGSPIVGTACACSAQAYCMHCASILHALSMHTACTMHAYCMHAAAVFKPSVLCLSRSTCASIHLRLMLW